MSYRGIPNWPPVWNIIDGEGPKRLRGEVGTLIQVQPPNIPETGVHIDHLFLRIEHDTSDYMGCLLFDDKGFCQYVERLLMGLCRRLISEIGSMDLTYML